MLTALASERLGCNSRPRELAVDHDAAMAELYGVHRQVHVARCALLVARLIHTAHPQGELGDCARNYRVEEMVGQRTAEFQRRRELTRERLART